MQQDYLFLIQFARAWSLAGYKSLSLEQMRMAQAGLNALLDVEIKLHVDYCQTWGVSETQLLNLPESPACVAYTRYVIVFFQSSVKAMIPFAMTMSFISAPIFAWLNYQLYQNKKVKNVLLMNIWA